VSYGSLLDLNSVEKKIKIMEDNVINRLVPRLRKIGIDVELFGNYPWIYLDKVNGNRIKKEDYYLGNHGFTIAFYPIKPGQVMELTDIKKVFEIIRKYK
jgi:hypothetical protein